MDAQTIKDRERQESAEVESEPGVDFFKAVRKSLAALRPDMEEAKT